MPPVEPHHSGFCEVPSAPPWPPCAASAAGRAVGKQPLASGPFGDCLGGRAASSKVSPFSSTSPGPAKAVIVSVKAQPVPLPFRLPCSSHRCAHQGPSGTPHSVPEPASSRLRPYLYRQMPLKAWDEPDPETQVPRGQTPSDSPGYTSLWNHTRLGQNLRSNSLSGTTVGISNDTPRSFFGMTESNFKSRKVTECVALYLATYSIPNKYLLKQ